MLIARSKGLNAINITGGAHALPKMFFRFFRSRKVYIAFDNDTAGKDGANKLAEYLKPYTTEVYNIDLPGLQNKEDL